VVIAWIVWPDKATRDAGHLKMQADPRVQHATKTVPFDGKRMIYGGVQTVARPCRQTALTLNRS